MKIVTFQGPEDRPTACVLSGDQVISLAGAGFADTLSLIAGGEDALTRARKHWEIASPVPLPAVKLKAPIPRPPKVICVGLNYRDHAEESKMEIPTVPTIFSKFPTSVIGPGDPIVLPKNSRKPDYEAEFAFVIGAGGRPWLVTADEIGDPHALDISITVSGEVLQSSNTRNLIFRIPDLIAYLSSVFTLEPGDIVSTGTPSGVGFARKPPRWLRPGDEVVVAVQGLGELRNPVVAEQ